MKKWSIAQPDDKIAQELRRGSNLSELCSQVLAARGFTEISQAAEFLQCEELADPFEITDMQEAVDCINDAIAEGKRICIYGDYDCDGITATVILYSYLTEIGADVYWRIPEREEGYGLNQAAVYAMHEDEIDLIITVDNGITAIEEAKLIQELGMELVITDHHQPLEELPIARAVIDLHRKDEGTKFHKLCGAGVALKLVAALDDGDYVMALEQFGELAAIATIADVVELSGENRYLVQLGLQVLANTERPGILALLDKAGLKDKPLTATSISYTITPRINASSRYGSPKTAVELLLTEDEAEAQALAQELENRNQQRKKMEETILQDIEGQIQKNPEILKERVLFLVGKGWHHGVIGIAAARLEERFGKPTMLMTNEDGLIRGSMRSFGAFSAFACLDACGSVLAKYGGHPKAGGFSLEEENLEAFHDLVKLYAKQNHPNMPVFTVEAEKLLLPKDLTVENVQGLQFLEPFGEGNPTPKFVLCHAIFQEVLPMTQGKHSRLKVMYGSMALDLLLFRTRPEEVALQQGDVCDFIITAELNKYRGNVGLSLKVEDYRKSGVKQSKYFSALQTYEQYCRQEALPKNYYAAIIPDRKTLVAMYQRIPQEGIQGDALFVQLQDMQGMNYCKFRLALDIFQEVKLLTYDIWLDYVKRCPVTEKVDLNTSTLLQQLQGKGEM